MCPRPLTSLVNSSKVNGKLDLMHASGRICIFRIDNNGRAIYGNLENMINTLYWPVENSIHKNND
jgi:hypothetical protein